MPHQVLLQVGCSARLAQMRLALKTGASTEEYRREGMQQFYIQHRKRRHRDRSSISRLESRDGAPFGGSRRNRRFNSTYRQDYGLKRIVCSPFTSIETSGMANVEKRDRSGGEPLSEIVVGRRGIEPHPPPSSEHLQMRRWRGGALPLS